MMQKKLFDEALLARIKRNKDPERAVAEISGVIHQLFVDLIPPEKEDTWNNCRTRIIDSINKMDFFANSSYKHLL